MFSDVPIFDISLICTVYSVQMYSEQCILYIMYGVATLFTSYTVQCTVYCVQFKG